MNMNDLLTITHTGDEYEISRSCGSADFHELSSCVPGF